MQVKQIRVLIDNVGAKKKNLKRDEALLFERWWRVASTFQEGNVRVPPLDLTGLVKLSGLKPAEAEKLLQEGK